MITLDDARRLTGTTAYGPDGDKVGTVGQVYLDNDSGQPEWVTVHTGLFGTNESLVPLEGAEVEGDTLRLAYDKSRIKDAPNIATDHELSPDDETELYRYYGVMTGRDDRGRLLDDRDDTSRATTDDATTRPREELRTGTEPVEAGTARLRKYVVTEHQQVDVPVTREEVRVETDVDEDRFTDPGDQTRRG